MNNSGKNPLSMHYRNSNGSSSTPIEALLKQDGNGTSNYMPTQDAKDDETSDFGPPM